jgi:hypothetical protein
MMGAIATLDKITAPAANDDTAFRMKSPPLMAFKVVSARTGVCKGANADAEARHKHKRTERLNIMRLFSIQMV